jgi:hypothetical protein
LHTERQVGLGPVAAHIEAEPIAEERVVRIATTGLRLEVTP